MGAYRKRPVLVQANQWFKMGDHAAVTEYQGGVGERYGHEGCGGLWAQHGWIETLEGGFRVCPGDWVVTGVDGEHYAVKPEIFVKTYDSLERTG